MSRSILCPEEPEDREQQRVRDQDGREDAERAADPELRDEVEPEEREAGHGDRDREAGEEDGPPRRGSRLGRGLAGRKPFVQQLPEAGDDEERVVDPDAEPDHRDEDRRDRVDVGQAREDEEQEERRRERGDRERDRDQHRHERAEDDQEDDDRGEQAEELRGPLLDGRELRLAVVLDRHPCRLDDVADGVLDRDDLWPVGVLDRLVELGLGVRDPTLLGERRLAERVADAVEARLAVLGLELRRTKLGDRALDGGLARRACRAAGPPARRRRRSSTAPCSEANSALIRSVARCVSEPGISNLSRRLPPIVPTRTIRSAMIPTQLATTRQG